MTPDLQFGNNAKVVLYAKLKLDAGHSSGVFELIKVEQDHYNKSCTVESPLCGLLGLVCSFEVGSCPGPNLVVFCIQFAPVNSQLKSDTYPEIRIEESNTEMIPGKDIKFIYLVGLILYLDL